MRVLAFVVALMVAAPAHAEPPKSAWGQAWQRYDSTDYWGLAIIRGEGPLVPDVAHQRWISHEYTGMLTEWGVKFMLGPLMLGLAWELDSPTLYHPYEGETRPLSDYYSAGFLTVVERYSVGLVSPPNPANGLDRVSVSFDIGVGFGGNLSFPHLLRFAVRPTIEFMLFRRHPGKKGGIALVMRAGGTAGHVSRVQSTASAPNIEYEGAFGMIGFRALWGSKFTLKQPPEPERPPKPEPPPEDSDGDGVFDPDAACVDVPEDLDGWQDEDGCPEDDNDGDGIPDAGDECPCEPEMYNSYYDADGCPDEVPEKLRRFVGVIQDIQFEVDSDRLKRESLPLLNDAVEVLMLFPEIRLQVQGHSSAEGDPTHNLELSWRRAESVRQYLVSKGVPAERIEAKGFGSTVPIADNETAEGRRQNRRVEFKVVRVQ